MEVKESRVDTDVISEGGKKRNESSQAKFLTKVKGVKDSTVVEGVNLT